MNSRFESYTTPYLVESAALDAFIERCLREQRTPDLVRLNTYLRRYLSPLVVAELFRRQRLPELLEQREIVGITALILDIRGFVRTTQSGERSSEGLDAVARLLRLFFSRIIRVAFERHGLVGEFAGDRVLITFGFPQGLESNPDLSEEDAQGIQIQRAVSTGFAIQRLSDEIRADPSLPLELRQFEVGIGICAGRRAWIGDIGSNHALEGSDSWRQELTVISAGVNIAARAEELTKNDALLAAAPERKIIAEERVVAHLRRTVRESHYNIRDLGEVDVRGMDERVRLFHVIDLALAAIDAPTPINDDNRQLVDWICARIDGAIERDITLRMHRSLSETGQSLVSSSAPNVGTVFEQIINQIRESFGAYKATLYRVDPITRELVVVQAIGPNPFPAGMRLPPDTGIAGMVATKGEAVVIPDVHHNPLWQGLAFDPATHSMLSVPLKAGGTIVGIIQVMDERIRAFSENDLATMNVFAGLATVALENARNYEQALRVARARTIITNAFSSAQTLDEVLNAVMEAVHATLEPRNATLYLIDRDTGDLIFEKIISDSANPPARGTRLPRGTGIVGTVVATRRARLIRDTQQDVDWYGRIGSDIRSIVCVPLIAHGQMVGAIQVLDRIPNRFDDNALEILAWLSASAAIAVNNAVQLEQARRKLVATEAIHGLAAISGKLAHNLKNQVGAIRTIARFQLKSEDPTTQQWIDRIIVAADRALAEVRAIMQPLTGWEPANVDLLVVLRDLVGQVNESLRERSDLDAFQPAIAIELQPDPVSHTVYAGRDQLDYIFRNLFDNARRAIAEKGVAGGLISVRTRHERINDDSWVVVEVADNGTGVSPETLDRIFDLGYTSRPEGSIGGYGLFWVRLNIERIGGRISASSEYGQGTMFELRFPLNAQ